MNIQCVHIHLCIRVHTHICVDIHAVFVLRHMYLVCTHMHVTRVILSLRLLPWTNLITLGDICCGDWTGASSSRWSCHQSAHRRRKKEGEVEKKQSNFIFHVRGLEGVDVGRVGNHSRLFSGKLKMADSFLFLKK